MPDCGDDNPPTGNNEEDRAQTTNMDGVNGEHEIEEAIVATTNRLSTGKLNYSDRK